MTIRTIRAGKTVFANGTLAAADSLVIEGGPAPGGAGGTAIISKAATNAGSITISGGAAPPGSGQPGGQGGLLDVLGVLTDQGVIELGAGKRGGGGGRLDVSGTLSITASASVKIDGAAYNSAGTADGGVLTSSGLIDNAGLLTLGGAPPGSSLSPSAAGYGGSLVNSGTLASSGTLIVQGGRSGYSITSGVGRGANLVDSGVLTNSGLLKVDSGASAVPYSYVSAAGGTVTVTGLLTNTGSLVLVGGKTARYGYSGGGTGGTLLDAGVVNNSGTIEIGGGTGTFFPRYSGYGDGALLSDSGSLSNTGTILVDGSVAARDNPAGYGGTLAVSGALSTSGSIRVSGGAGGLIAFAPADSAGGVLLDSGDLTVDGGTLTIGGGAAGKVAYGAGGGGGTLMVTQAGNLVNTAMLVVQGGTGSTRASADPGQGGVLEAYSAISTGTIALQAGTAGQNGGAGGGGASLVVDGDVATGVLTIAAGGTGPGAGGSASLILRAGSQLNEYYGTTTNAGLISLGAGSDIYGGKLQNSGTISGQGTLFRVALTNDGVIDAGSGTLTLQGVRLGGGSGSGLLHAGAGGLLAITGGSIDASQTVSLDSATATLSVTAGDAGVLVTSPASGTVEVTQGGIATLNAADANLRVFLNVATDLTLSRMSAIAATGSSGNDTITALSSGQTLTGAAGTDALTGAVVTGDLFIDTALGLNGDTIIDFAGTDVIDITDIASGAGLALTYMQQGDHGLLTLSNGSSSTTITLQGHFTTSSFTTGSDGHGGVRINL